MHTTQNKQTVVEWEKHPDTIEKHQKLAEQFLSSLSEYPRARYEGRGIVICAGGSRYFIGGWVCMRMLRHLGCTLPIQFWHLPREIDPRMEMLVKGYGVECIDAERIREKAPARILNGWELKPYAIIHCPFKEVLSLDADNVPVSDPSSLFADPHYQTTGAVFWPDYGRLGPERLIWDICGVKYRDEPEFETGQILVNKAVCWKALQLAMHYNEYSDFYYRHIHGDKETFHLAFHRLNQLYEMPPYPIKPLQATMCQHDFNGNVLFQHRNLDKWQLDGKNQRIKGFRHENLCLDFLQELRRLWSGFAFRNRSPDDKNKELMGIFAGRTFLYTRVGHDSRLLEFKKDGSIGRGKAACEQFWSVYPSGKELYLVISGEDKPTCFLKRNGDGVWKGQWIFGEKMDIELTETPAR